MEKREKREWVRWGDVSEGNRVREKHQQKVKMYATHTHSHTHTCAHTCVHTHTLGGYHGL